MYLRKIFSNKLKLLQQCRLKWPKYLSFNEDLQLRGTRWDASYSDKRIIFCDNTDIPINTPADAEHQRNTYSAYYAGNVGKGAVFIQPSGWMGTHDLWMGAVSDSEYLVSKIGNTSTTTNISGEPGFGVERLSMDNHPRQRLPCSGGSLAGRATIRLTTDFCQG